MGSKINSLLGYLLPIFSMLGLGISVAMAVRAVARKAHIAALAMVAGQILLIPFWFGNVAISRLGLVGLITNLLILFIAFGSPKQRIAELRQLLR
jgi:site-specific recombinase